MKDRKLIKAPSFVEWRSFRSCLKLIYSLLQESQGNFWSSLLEWRSCPPLLLLFLKFLGEKGEGLVLLYRNFLFKCFSANYVIIESVYRKYLEQCHKRIPKHTNCFNLQLNYSRKRLNYLYIPSSCRSCKTFSKLLREKRQAEQKPSVPFLWRVKYVWCK